MKTELDNIESAIKRFGKNLVIYSFLKKEYNRLGVIDYENYYIKLYNGDMRNNTISLHN